MKVEEYIRSEFIIFFEKRHIRLSGKMIKQAAEPFDFDRLQRAIDSDLASVEAREGDKIAGRYARIQREAYHKDRLDRIIRDYAILLRQKGFGTRLITEEIHFALTNQMKQSTASECDVYPCEKSEDRGRGREQEGGCREI